MCKPLSRIVPLVLLAATAAPASAQNLPGGGIAPPAVSPYLNVVRSGAPYGLNYYNIVQPQLQFQSEITQLQQQANVYQSQQAQRGIAGLDTGHAATFNNYSHYYGRRGQIVLGAGQAGGFGGAPVGFGAGAGGFGGAPGGMGQGIGQNPQNRTSPNYGTGR